MATKKNARAHRRKPAPLVEVSWFDSKGIGGWVDVEKAQKEQPAPCTTVGDLITRDRRRIVIVQTMSAMPEDDVQGSASIVIPAGCVHRVRSLR
jgi:hypothetical protein